MSDAAPSIAERVAQVRDRVRSACEQNGRAPASVQIIAVSKTHPPSLAREAVAAGMVDLGENRVQELVAKRDHVPGARWHLVGPLQRNKVRHVVGHQVLVHSLDRRRLADALSRQAEQQGALQRALVQVNVGADPAKSGCAVDEALDLVAYARDLPSLAVEGLMTIPPLPPADVDASEHARTHFATLRRLRDEARERFPEVVHLSMGMSSDLEAAVAEGATIVRVGTAVFGARGQGPWDGQQEAP